MKNKPIRHIVALKIAPMYVYNARYPLGRKVMTKNMHASSLPNTPQRDRSNSGKNRLPALPSSIIQKGDVVHQTRPRNCTPCHIALTDTYMREK